MGSFLILLGTVGILASFVMLIVRLVSKKGLVFKQILGLAVISLILGIAGAAISPTAQEGYKQAQTQQPVDQVSQTEQKPPAEQNNNNTPASQTPTNSSKENNNSSAAPVKQEDNKKEEKIASLGFDVDEFKKRFNKAAQEFKSDMRIDNIKVESGAVQDTFQYMLTSHLGIVGAVNKEDGNINSITIIGQGDGTVQSGLNIMVSMGILIATVNPELSPDERGNILKELGIIGDNVDILNLNKDTIRNGKKYFITSSKELGIMFGVENANVN